MALKVRMMPPHLRGGSQEVEDQPVISDEVPVVQETLTVRSKAAAKPTSRTDLMSDNWGHQELRDYVCAEIYSRFGEFPRDARKETAIFKRFHKEFGDMAGGIARYAFENCNGYWKGAPIGVNRFCKGSDVWFAIPILERLTED